VPARPPIEGVQVDTVDIIYRGVCERCAGGAGQGEQPIDLTGEGEADLRQAGRVTVGGDVGGAGRGPGGGPMPEPGGEPAGAGSRGNARPS